MAQSTITSKFQTTVPKEIRETLGVGVSDVLQWELVGSQVRVSATSPAFLARRGSVKVGSGDVVEDVRTARERMGTRRI
jgi:bifunctional DNA-binding transcriptional regulator/antitoxin component of YhaV-PrlF toxin-antitoxin module